MEWYVYRHDSNKGKIIKYNVVNTGVIDHLIKMLNQIKEEKGHWNYDDFTAAAMQIYRYYYWGKCEHEIIIKEWVGREAEEKVDVFDQLMLNWDIFVDHLYDYVIELMSSKGEEESEECPEDCLCHTCAAAKDCDRLVYESCCGCRKIEDDMVTRCISFIGEEENEPTCDSAWWIADSSRGVWICANCKSNALYWGKDVFLSDFCPHCGARMENCSCGFMMK